ncbi:hypothetical protein [Streptomyces sp. NPDC088358]|uniref:hypothetical protein n=1 Tax=Streptomyces sp. NPDC088358 TaxID=3365857 RepID=UPI0037FDDC1F
MSKAVAFMGLGQTGGSTAADLVKAGHRECGNGLVGASLRTAAGSGVERAASATDAVAETVAGMSPPVAERAKAAVARAVETTLTEGVRSERPPVHAVFATTDRKEGGSAFAEKRPAPFTHH